MDENRDRLPRRKVLPTGTRVKKAGASSRTEKACSCQEEIKPRESAEKRQPRRRSNARPVRFLRQWAPTGSTAAAGRRGFRQRDGPAGKKSLAALAGRFGSARFHRFIVPFFPAGFCLALAPAMLFGDTVARLPNASLRRHLARRCWLRFKPRQAVNLFTLTTIRV